VLLHSLLVVPLEWLCKLSSVCIYLHELGDVLRTLGFCWIFDLFRVELRPFLELLLLFFQFTWNHLQCSKYFLKLIYDAILFGNIFFRIILPCIKHFSELRSHIQSLEETVHVACGSLVSEASKYSRLDFKYVLFLFFFVFLNHFFFLYHFFCLKDSGLFFLILH